MTFNVPDDWGQYYSNCRRCNTRTHASEVYMCDCTDELETLDEAIAKEIEELSSAASDGDYRKALDHLLELEGALETAKEIKLQAGLY